MHLTHKNVASALDKLSRCLEDVKRWLSTNKLKLIPDKTKFIVFGSKSQPEKLNHSFPVNILGNLISPVDAVRNFGVWFDSDFSFSCHLKRLRGHLTHEAALMAAKYSHITPVRKTLHWLLINYCSIFKTAVLVYKFLHSGNPKYFEPFLIPRHSAYNIRQSQSDGMFLEVPTLLQFSSLESILDSVLHMTHL